MSSVIVINPAVSDVSICLALDPPTRGIDVGGGLHVIVPVDWQNRILQGQQVPGCTYAHIEPDGSLVVSDTVQNNLNNVQLVTSLNLNAGQVSSLKTEIATGTVVVGNAQALPANAEISI